MATDFNREYSHSEIEKKWQTIWAKQKVYKTKGTKGKKMYVLDMFPYPSGKGLHVGHPKGYIGSDVYARTKRMQGFNVLHPMGYDAFGLPAEQYALEHHINPKTAVEMNVKTFESQLNKIGFSYDWDRRVNTTDPEFYKWTQWIFLKLYESWYNPKTKKAEPISSLIKILEKQKDWQKNWKAKTEKEKEEVLMNYRLAYEGYSEVNWSPILGTVLANDEIVDGPKGPVSERGGFPVEKKQMRQWFLRITAYADRLLKGLDTLDWSDHIKEIQKNWIGKSLGSEISFEVISKEIKSHLGFIKVFTTRPDTLFGVTYVVLAPEHPLLNELLKKDVQNSEEVRGYIAISKNKKVEDRGANKEKTGVELKGVRVKHPITEELLPVWVSDYVLMDYGTGAVMAVPSHDERDFEFATKYNLPRKEVILSGGTQSAFTGTGILINSGKYNGRHSEQVKADITKEAHGTLVVKYKMRDAVFARQRYWGEPIPLVHKKDGTIIEYKKLPLKLPEVKSYEPTGTGESPLASVPSWTKQGFETNTMPGWAGSSWYFLRYMDPNNKKSFADKKSLKYWKNVDVYVGGAEHATGHLLYSRFWHKFLKDLGLVMTEEPFQSLKNQGMILGTDNRKMSKRWGNVVNPDDIVASYGADTLRLYEMFMGPFDASLPWNTESIIGSRRFLDRIWRTRSRVASGVKSSENFESSLHRTISKVTEDIGNFAFNTAVSSMMILLNEMDKQEKINKKDFELFLKILSPFAPHIAEEIWHDLGNKSLIVTEKWPTSSKSKMKQKEVRIAIQINSRVRGELLIPTGAKEDYVVEQAKSLHEVGKWLLGKEIKKIIYIKDRLLNLVVV